MGYVKAVLEDGTTVDGLKPNQDAQQRGFATAGRAKNGEELPIPDGKADAMKDTIDSEALAYIRDNELRGRFFGLG
jgi:hypothetical protein